MNALSVDELERIRLQAERDAMARELEFEAERAEAALHRVGELEGKLVDQRRELAALRAELAARRGPEATEIDAETEPQTLAARLRALQAQATSIERRLDLAAATALPDWVPLVAPPDGPIVRPDLTVACMVDPVSRTSLGFEFNVLDLRPDTWRRRLTEQRPDFVFVEAGSSAPGAAQLVDWCRAAGIPTVFWNTGDPANFDQFAQAALLFDHVFTVDPTSVPRYERLGHRSVHVLPFGVQPRLHNPVAVPARRTRPVGFAEAWDSRAGALLEAAGEFGLEVLPPTPDGPAQVFPAGIAERIVGSLSHEQLASAAKLYRVFLTTEPGPLPRRVLELLATGTPVVSAAAQGVDPDLVWRADSADETRRLLATLLRDPELGERKAAAALRAVLGAHTCSDRVDHVLRVTGVAEPRQPVTASLVCPTYRSENLDRIFANVAHQTHRPLELVLGLHGSDLDAATVARHAKAAGVEHVEVVKVDADATLGAVLNAACARSSGDYLLKIDDDDFYGPHYVEDLVNAFLYTSATVVGKRAVYVLLEASERLILRYPEHEHRYAEIVQGSTITVPRGVWEDQHFADLPRAVDTEFLRAAAANGGTFYSADRFNYVAFRAADKSRHTWQIADDDLLERAVVQPAGATFDHAVA